MNKRKKANSIVTVALAATFLGSAYMLGRDIYISRKEKAAFESVSRLADSNTDEGLTKKAADKEEHRRDISALISENSDCIGWIYIDGTRVDYPVMYTPDNPQKYINTDFYGKSSSSGVPFIDGTRPLECDNTIIFGHNMKNGTMFADIKKYADSDFCKEHPEIEFETSESCGKYTVFAVAEVLNDDKWYAYDKADGKKEYDDMASYIRSKALYETGVIPEYGQKIITLSTCYGSSDEMRLIVAAAEKQVY